MVIARTPAGPNNPVSLEEVLTTAQLQQRASRPPDYAGESRVMGLLAQSLADSPDAVLQRLAEVAMDAFAAGSAGVSLAVEDESGPRFHWPAIAGAWNEHIGSGLPQASSPCGVVLDRKTVQLFTLPERHYTYMFAIKHPIHEALLAPFFIDGEAIGTVWVIAHDPDRKFDGEDARLLMSMAQFAAGAYQVWRSIQESRKKSAALLESEGLFYRMADDAPVMVWVTEKDGSCSYLSKSWYDFTGQDEDAGLGLGWLEAVHPEDRDATAHVFADANQGHEPCRLEYRLRRRDGVYRWAIDFARPRFAEDGELLGFIGSVLDITERKQTEEALARMSAESDRQRRLYDTIISSTPDLVYVFDLNYRFTFANNALLQMWGRTLDESIGKSLLEIGYELWHAEMHEREIDQVVATKQPIRGEVPFRHATLGTRTYDYIFVPVLNEKGEVESIAGTTRDITELKRAEEQLREADRRKDEFLATLAHELRNPLAAIRMAVELLSRSQDQVSTAEMGAIIDRQSSQLVRLIDDLLDVSRITRGKIELRKERVDLGSVIAHAVEGVRVTCSARELHLTVTPPEEPIAVIGDPIRLAQIIANLLSNACKYTERDGCVRLIAQKQGEQAVIRVQDTGVGIASENLRNIFEMFSQVNPMRDRAMGGLGIGLALVRQLVELHGGKIEAHSDGLGKGAEFVVRLPVAPREDANSNNSPKSERDSSEVVVCPAASSTASNRRRILAVDDNLDALETVVALLRLAGHEVNKATSGEQALDMVEALRPSVVLLDIGLPGMDGYEVARRIRNDHGQDVLLIAMTGWGQDEDKRRSLDAGFDAHLTKPADPELLERLLRQGSPAAAQR